jgi:hypothetical protein
MTSESDITNDKMSRPDPILFFFEGCAIHYTPWPSEEEIKEDAIILEVDEVLMTMKINSLNDN